MVISSWPIARSRLNIHTPQAAPTRPPHNNSTASAGSSARRRQ